MKILVTGGAGFIASHVVDGYMVRLFSKLRPVVVLFALVATFFEHLRLNRGVNREDLPLISPENLKKIFGGWEASDILKKGRRTLKQ